MTSLATVAEFCKFVGSPVPADPTRIQALLDDASAEVRGFTGQVLTEVLNESAVFPSWQSALIVLPQRPVNAVDSVTVDAVVVTASDYEWTRGGHLWRLDGTAWEAATVVYDHGFAAASEDLTRIKAICIASASRAWSLNERSASEAMGSTLLESAGYSPEIFLTPGEQDRLSAYGGAVFA